MTRAIALTIALTAACTPQQLDRMAQLLDLDVDPHDPQALALAADVWCARGPELVDAVGVEALEGLAGPLPACHPPGWVDLGHGVYGPPHLIAIRACESTDRYDAVSPSGTYRGGYQFAQTTWNEQAALSGRPDLVGADPAAAAPADQDRLAVDLYERNGPGPWPHCGARR